MAFIINNLIIIVQVHGVSVTRQSTFVHFVPLCFQTAAKLSLLWNLPNKWRNLSTRRHFGVPAQAQLPSRRKCALSTKPGRPSTTKGRFFNSLLATTIFNSHCRTMLCYEQSSVTKINWILDSIRQCYGITSGADELVVCAIGWHKKCLFKLRIKMLIFYEIRTNTKKFTPNFYVKI